MATISISSQAGKKETLRSLLLDGINDEKKKIEYALSLSSEIIKGKENFHKISSVDFLDKFKRGEIKEDDDTFQWWAELKLADTLKEKLETIYHLEICQQ